MKTVNIASLLMDNCKTVDVRFASSEKQYTYKTTEDFEVGDYAVANTPNGVKTVRITAVHKVPQIDINSNYEYQWLVCKVDFQKYDELIEKESLFSEQLLELEHRSICDKAKLMLSEELGLDSKEMNKLVKNLND